MDIVPLCRRIVDRARWELREWRWPSRPSFLQEELDRVLLDEIAWRPGERVLDVGCAHGAYLDILVRRGVEPVGIDIRLDVLRVATRRGFIVAASSGEALPFAAESFDTILCHKTLYLFPSPAAAAGEFARVLRDGGRVVFSGSNTVSPYARFQTVAVQAARNGNWRYANRWGATDWCREFARWGLHRRTVYSCNLVWPFVFRVCDRWLIPNEWMRRYNRWIRRVTRTPLRTHHPLGAAMDYVIEVVKPAARTTTASNST